MPKNTENKSDNSDLLNEIIQIQFRLAQANFDLDAFMNQVAKEMQILTPATGVIIELAEEDENTMVYRAATGSAKDSIGLRLPLKGSLSGLCILTKEVLRCDDTEKDPRVNIEAARKEKSRSAVVAPLFYQGKAIGVLEILSEQVSAFSETDVQTLQLMAGFIASALAHQILYESNQQLLLQRTKALNELQKAQAQLRHMADYDSLTSLANRNFFNTQLERSLSSPENSKQMIALLYIDIDHFKRINDNFGHDIGDQLLMAFALRLKNCIREEDLAARLGGDEFVVFIEEINKLDDAETIVKKILSKMEEAFKLKSQTINITVSIGISFSTKDKLNPEKLIQHADQALYNAKIAGRNTFRVFES